MTVVPWILQPCSSGEKSQEINFTEDTSEAHDRGRGDKYDSGDKYDIRNTKD